MTEPANPNPALRVIIGAGATSQAGWISTQLDQLDLLDEATWQARFAPGSLSHLLAEHVWEHLDFDQGVQAARTCYRYLAPGGLLRVAVPDGNFRNDWYQNMVKPGGPGPKDHPAASHKILYTLELFTQVFEQAGFTVEPLEWCDHSGTFHYRYWNQADGMIGRSLRFDTRNSQTSLGMVSIILDAKKEGTIPPA